MQTDAELAANPLEATVDILIRTLRELGKAGKPDIANRLAARAYVSLRTSEPRSAERINGVMHFLARLPDEQELPPSNPSRQETT